MSKSSVGSEFDPYESWLGIKESQRPLSFYQLLGLPEFETDVEKIKIAVEDRAALLQMKTGNDLELAKQLLSELGQARLWLTSEIRKSEYDQQLELRMKGHSAELKLDFPKCVVNSGVNSSEQDENQDGKKQFQRDDSAIELPSIKPAGGLPLNQLDTSSSVPPILKPSGSNTDQEHTAPQNKTPSNDAEFELQMPAPNLAAVTSVDSVPPEFPTAVEASADEQVKVVSADLQSERIESQRAKEVSDAKWKSIFDKLIWTSCGVCIIAIVVVVVSRSSGCHREPTIADAESSADSKVKTKKISGKGSSLTLKDNKAGKAKPSKSLLTPNDASDSKGIKETFGYFRFDNKTGKNDLLPALGPLRIINGKWSKNESGGELELTNKSQVFVDRADLLNRVTALTFIGRFKLSDATKTFDWLSINDQIIVRSKDEELSFTLNGKFDEKGVVAKLDDSGSIKKDKWYSLALLGDENEVRLLLDGNELQKIPKPLPSLVAKKNQLISIGSSGAGNQNQFVGRIDDIGLFWKVLTVEEMNSLSDVK